MSCTAPTTAATGLSTAYISNTSASVSYTAPTTGNEIIIVCRPTSLSAIAPTGGLDYPTASLDYNSAPTLGDGKIVYSGTNTSATKIITNLDCATNYSFDIYSRESDGDCYFTTEATTAYTTKRLWDITYTQASSTDVAPGENDVELYRIDLSIGGSIGTINYESLQITSGNDDDSDVEASSIKLYRTTTTTFVTTNQIGTGKSFSGGLATFNTTYDLPQGITYLWVAVDVSATAGHTNLLDLIIAPNGLTIDGTTYPTSIENPSGSRTIMSSENNGYKCEGNIEVTGTWEHIGSVAPDYFPTEYIMLAHIRINQDKKYLK